VLGKLVPNLLEQLRVEIPKLQKPENAPWLEKLKQQLIGKDAKDLRKRLKDKEWFPKDWLPPATMKPLPTFIFDFEFLTPCFSGTAEGKNADASILRVPPIRGHIRMWHVSLFGAADANAVWGSTAGDGCGSKVGVALKASPPPSKQTADILPHKENERQRGSRAALPAGSRATLVLTRLPGCTDGQWDHAEKAAKLWLLLGTLGLRANRAAGSVWPSGEWVPQDVSGLKTTLATLGYSKPVQYADASLSSDKRMSYEKNEALKLRHAASDMVNGSPKFFGDIKPTRQPSPLKMKVARLGGAPVLLLTGLSTADMTDARYKLKGHPLGDVPWLSI